MARLLTILFVGLICEAIGVILLSRGLKEITGWLLTPEELKDPQGLAARLSGHADPYSQSVWRSLSQEEQRILSDPAAPRPRKTAALWHGLNRYLETGPDYDSNVYRGVQLSRDTQKRIGRAVQESDRVELRRLLLQDVLPNEVSKQSERRIGVGYVLGLIGRGITNAHILLGVFFEALFFVGLLMLMSRADVSFVWPLTSLSFVVTTIAAKIYLHEEVSLLRWSGVCLIMLGAGIISWTEKQHSEHPSSPPVATDAGQRAPASR